VKVSETTVMTFAAESTWRDAIEHYFRGKKTVRWCQPAGFAGLIIIQPMLGWLVAVLLHPLSAVAWLGLAATGQVEGAATATLFWLIGCELRSWSASVCGACCCGADVGCQLDAVAGRVPLTETEMVELVSFGAAGRRVMKQTLHHSGCRTNGSSLREADAMSGRVVVTGVGAVTPLGLNFRPHGGGWWRGRRGGAGHTI